MTLIGRRQNGVSLVSSLMVGTAVSVLTLASAQAQAPGTPSIETVVVTGTSIRGAQPVGQDLITVGRSDIEATGAQNMQQLLSTVPQVNTFGGSGQGGSNGDFTGQLSPAIHGIGGGSSAATLILIDGHRIPVTGLTAVSADPSVVPTSMLERVEILPDGASSIYGSDAVAGVLNFVTRKDFTGMEFNVQGGIADHYNTFEGSAMLGRAWSGGSFMAGYDYSDQSNLEFGTRKFTTTRQDIYRGAADPLLFTGIAAAPPAGSMTVTPPAGPGTTGPFGVAIPYPSSGTNFQNFNCPVATIAASSSANAFYYQPGGGYGGSSYSTTTSGVPSQGACDQASEASLLPATTRNNVMMQFREELTNDLVLDVEAVFGSRAATSQSSRGTVNAQVFGPTAPAANASQINPFYVGNATTGTSSEFVRYDFNALLGPGAYSKTFSSNAFVTSGLSWDLGNDREIVLSGVGGTDFSYQHVSGVVSSAEALLALNGTTNTNGTLSSTSEQDVYGTGTLITATRPLNTTNALDVWDPAGPTNKTSAAIISGLKDGGNFTDSTQDMEDVTAKFDGPVFDLPAGPVKTAAGVEFLHATTEEWGTTNNSVGPSTSNSASYYFGKGRTIYSAFLEFNAPLVSPEMNVPLIEKLAVDISGRYDKYSGNIGDTENPKVGFDWLVTDGLMARGSYGTSFVAPTIHDSFAPDSQSTIAAAGNFANPIIPFGDTRPFNGGAGLAGTWVSTASSCAAGNGTVVNSAGATVTGPAFTGAFGCKVNFAATNGAGTSAGLNIAGGNNNLLPATGRSWSGGFDLDVGKLTTMLPGLTINATYWDVAYRGLITNQQTQNNIPQLTYFAPIGGWTPTSPYIQQFISGKPITIALPAQIWGTTNTTLQNAFNLWENGIDFGANYSYPTDSMGTFKFGLNGTQLLRYSQQGGNTGPILDTKDGANAPRYNSWELSFRTDIGWTLDALHTDLAMNYIHPEGVTDSNFPYNLAGPGRGFPNGSPSVFTSQGIAHIGAQITFDLAANYALPQGFVGLPDVVVDGSSISLTVQNILDTAPPYDPALQNGYLATGNPIGRLVEIGVRKKL